MKKALKCIIKSFIAVLLLILLYFIFSQFYFPTFDESDGKTYNKSVYHQLQFLKEELHNGAGDEMQSHYPEGFLFINTLYGLSWCNLIRSLNSTSPIRQEGIKQIDWAIDQVLSEKAKLNFDHYLPMPNGAFYLGWTNYLLANKLALQQSEERNKTQEFDFKQNCEQISAALLQSNTPYLESYNGLSWPADMTSAIASLSIHDEIFEPEYKEVIESWITLVKTKLDPATGLIPHQTDSQNGESIEGARGSSQSLILNFLYEIDKEFATQQFHIYIALFLDYRFGLPGIREYPKGIQGGGDIDSGPVILDIGGAASIVGQRTMLKFGEIKMYKGLRNSIEMFGVGYTSYAKKKYLFGKLPIADAFICWSNAIENKLVIDNISQ